MLASDPSVTSPSTVRCFKDVTNSITSNKAAAVFKGIQYFALKSGENHLKSVDDINHKMPTARWDSIFTAAFASLIQYINTGRIAEKKKPLTNPGEMNYTTCYDSIRSRLKTLTEEEMGN